MNWLQRLFARKPRFPLPFPERCEACNHWTDDPHTVSETFDEGDGTGTEMSATYCPEHCPGRCDHPRDVHLIPGTNLDRLDVDPTKPPPPPPPAPPVRRS